MTINISHVASKLSNSLVYQNPVVRILEFGMHAYADSFLSINELGSSEPIFPLNVVMDDTSGLFHNEYLTPAFDRYNRVEYSYTSSNSKFFRSHWATFLPLVKSLGGKKGHKIIEVGSNDGYLCSLFIEEGFKAYGIDASKSMTDLANMNGVNTYNKIFNSFSAIELSDLLGKSDFLIANNVFNHSNDPLDFLFGVKQILNESGIFIIEVPYWKIQIENYRFDMVYHEHITYFTVRSLKKLIEDAGLFINDIEIVESHGGSLRVIGGKKFAENDKVNKMISDEINSGIFNIEYYLKAAHKIKAIRAKTMDKIFQINSNEEIFGIGAAAKANTLLTYYGINSTIISAVTDSSPYKIGKYTPLTRIPIVPDSNLAKSKNCWAMILSWNIGNDLRNTLSKINPKIKYIEL